MKENKFQFAFQTGFKILLFLVVMSLLPFHHGIVFWMSIAFTVLSFFVYVFGKYRSVYVKPNAKSSMYGCMMEEVFDKFLKIEIASCFVFIIVGKWIPIWFPMIAYCVLVAAAVSGLESESPSEE